MRALLREAGRTIGLLILLSGSAAAQDAFSRFETLERETGVRAGDPAFDYALGLAALAARQPAEAVFALTRVLMNDPGHVEARLALARAYVHLGDLGSARREIAAVTTEAEVPPALAAILERYVAALDAALADRAAALDTAIADSAYYRGVTLLDAGRATEAAEVLRGIVEAHPDHLPARAELGRAYASQGDFAAARRELAMVADQDTVPAEVRDSMDRYIAALDARLDAQRRTRVSGYVRVRSGYDSNVNNATDEERILIPAFAALGLGTLSADAREQEDGFAETSARLSVVHATSGRARLVADLSANVRNNFDEVRFDQTTFGGSLGYGWETANGSVTLAGQAQTFRVDHEVFRNAFGVLAGWRTRTRGGKDLSLNLQFSDLDFPDNDTRDAHRGALGATVGAAVAAGHTYLFGGAYAGREETTDGRFDHLSQWFMGARAGVETRTSDRLALFAAIVAERQIYDEDEPVFMTARRTWRADLRGGLRYRLSRDIDLLVEAGYTRADSNIVLFDYDRVTASMRIEYAF